MNGFLLHFSVQKMASSSLVFKVRRNEPEMITPAKPTPHEFKYLSEIDDQMTLRLQIPVIQFYGNNNLMEGRDPVEIIRNVISDVLVFYYPLAGRLREGPAEKLIVECTGEGIIFIEAEADVRLDQLGDAILPPCPWLEELLYDVPGSASVLDCPLLLIQVTRLLCGGFVFALRLNHTMADASGLVQFMNAVAEMARAGAGAGGGKKASTPSVQPIWQRELLSARNPPRITCIHREFEPLPDTRNEDPMTDYPPMAYQSFFFGPQEISALGKHVPLGTYTTLEILIGFLWRCRTIALNPHPEDEVRLIIYVNARQKCRPPLPVGFYGNSFATPVAFTSAGELCQNSVGYAAELVKKLKDSVTDEYMRSLADLLVIKGRPLLEVELTRTYMVSDLTHAGFDDVDYGWGKPIYGGPAETGVELIPGLMSFYSRFRNQKDEDGILVPVCLPAGATMEKFEMEVRRLTKEPVPLVQRLPTKL